MEENACDNTLVIRTQRHGISNSEEAEARAMRRTFLEGLGDDGEAGRQGVLLGAEPEVWWDVLHTGER